MAEEETRQEQLDTNVPPEQTGSLQETILKYYSSDNLFHTTIGFWAKLLVEAAIVSVPIAVIIVIPGFILSVFDVSFVSFGRTVAVWSAFSITVMGCTWCFTQATEPSNTEFDEN